MTLCQFVEIEGRPGYQWCPVCARPRGWPNEQRRPSALPANLRRACTAASVVPKKSRGLGDTVAKVIDKATGGRVKPCGGCKERQAWLNKLVPYRDTADDGRAG